MSALLVTDLVGSVIVIMGFTVGAVRWGRGTTRAVARWIQKVGDNTTATLQLTEVIDRLGKGVDEVLDTLRRHDQELAEVRDRLERVEKDKP